MANKANCKALATTESEISTSELNARAQAITERVRRERSRRIKPPYIGIPMLPGSEPFVVRRDLLESQTDGLDDLRARFLLVGDTFRLETTGRFGRYGENTHRVSFVSQYHRGWYGLKIDHWRVQLEWANKYREQAIVPSDPEKVSPKQSRIEAKIIKIDKEIARLSRKIDRGLWPPVNPLMGHKGSYSGKYDEYTRDLALRYYREKPSRKQLSRLSAKYLQNQKVRQNRCRGLTMVFPWKEFYAELAEHGIKVTETYVKVHNRKGGPEHPEIYLRNPQWFGLLADKSRASIEKPRDIGKEMAYHKNARMDYLGELGVRRTVESIIEGLRAQRQGFTEALAELKRETTGDSGNPVKDIS